MDAVKRTIFWNEVRKLQDETGIKFIDQVRLYERPDEKVDFLLGVPVEIQTRVLKIYNNIK